MSHIDLTQKSGPELVALFNEHAEAAGLSPVKRFADTISAVRRVSQLLGQPVPEGFDIKKSRPQPAVNAEKKTAPKPPAKAAPKKKIKAEGEIVRKGSYRDSLMKYFEKHEGQQISISRLMVATYGEARKDLKGPLMMVIKGLRIVISENKLGFKIEKTRENKENHFGLISTKKS